MHLDDKCHVDKIGTGRTSYTVPGSPRGPWTWMTSATWKLLPDHRAAPSQSSPPSWSM